MLERPLRGALDRFSPGGGEGPGPGRPGLAWPYRTFVTAEQTSLGDVFIMGP